MESTRSGGGKVKDPSSIKRRITQACILCRKKKIKCDGAKPECVHCQDANLQCQYTEYKKRGPHKGYVRLLEERLLQLEKRLTSAGAEIPPPISPSKNFPSTKTSDSATFEAESNGAHNNEGVNGDDFPPPEILNHLVELFFQYINSVFPLVHRARLKQSIKEGTVSRPLLWSVMAISARFSDHPSIKTEPPYWAGERFALKATSLINASMLEPTIPNLQFWGIMSCLEYGRASGSKAWIYGGIAVRICQELGLNKESTLKTPIMAADGSIDYVAMALRRRIFWSTLCIDKFASTSTNRPQGFDIGDYDAKYPSLGESRILRDPLQGFTLNRTVIDNDPLMDIIPRYISVLERFGEIAKYMSRAKTDTATIIWPPIPEFDKLDAKLRKWKDDLPEDFQFSAANLAKFRDSASPNYLNFYICSHAMYCTTKLVLHRGSLAYSDLTSSELPVDIFNRIQSSIQECKTNVDIAIEVFKNLRDIFGWNVLPYMGYSAYIFSTVLMTSAFSTDARSYEKSSAGLATLFDTIKLLGPYWPMSERLALTTRDMLAAHSRLYEIPEQEYNYETSRPLQTQTMQSIAHPQNQPQNQSQQPMQPTSQPQISINNGSDMDSLTSISTAETPNLPPTSIALSYPSFVASSNTNGIVPLGQQQLSYSQQQPQQQQQPQPQQQQKHQQQQQQQQPQQQPQQEVDFNSCEFLYDSALFGQIIFDSTKNDINFSSQYSLPMSNPTPMYYQQQQQQQQQHSVQHAKQTSVPWGI